MAVLENIITHSMSIVPPHRSFGASSPVGGSIVGDAPKNRWGQRRGTRRTEQSVVTALRNWVNLLYFAGRMMELSGKSDIARKYYTRCLETESKERCNYVLASVALRR